MFLLFLLFPGRCVVSGTRSTWGCSAPLDSPLSTGFSHSHGRIWFVLLESLGHLDDLSNFDHFDHFDHQKVGKIVTFVQVPPELAEPLLCTTFTLTYFFHLTSFYWMFLEGFYLFLQVQYTRHKWRGSELNINQVQFPLSLVSIKYKHFLLFGLGGPIINTLVWFTLRVQDESHFEEEHHSRNNDTFSKWEETDKPLVCLFVEDKPMDVWVMQVSFN